MRPRKTSLAALVLIGIALAVPGEVRSADRHWDNDSGDDNWHNELNWDPDGSPAPSEELSVHTGTPHAASSVTTDGGGLIVIYAGASATFDSDLLVGDTGIGLSIAEKVVKAYAGEIRACNDNGACFKFSLPASQRGPAAEKTDTST